MKARTGFISNSSSTSYIVVGNPPKPGNYAQLTEDQIEKVIFYLAEEKEENSFLYREVVRRDPDEPVYMTSYFSDMCSEEVFELLGTYHFYPYEEGDHGTPYYSMDEDGKVDSHVLLAPPTYKCENFTRNASVPFGNGVWIRKEHS